MEATWIDWVISRICLILTFITRKWFGKVNIQFKAIVNTPVFLPVYTDTIVYYKLNFIISLMTFISDLVLQQYIERENKTRTKFPDWNKTTETKLRKIELTNQNSRLFNCLQEKPQDYINMFLYIKAVYKKSHKIKSTCFSISK